jgi:hypothetical protein
MDNCERNAEMLKRSDEGASLADIGREFGLSRERSRKIILKARRLRENPYTPRADGRPHLTTRTRNACINALWDKFRVARVMVDYNFTATDDEIVAALRQHGLLEDGGEGLLDLPHFGKSSLANLRAHIGRQDR